MSLANWIGFLIIAIIAVGLVFNAAGVKRHFTRAIQSHYWCLNKTVLLWNISGFFMFRKRNGTPNEVR